MDNFLTAIIGLIIAFIAGFFINRRASKRDAEIIDITKKIEERKQEISNKKEVADTRVKEYLDALREYDPDFDDDDNGGTPSA